MATKLDGYAQDGPSRNGVPPCYAWDTFRSCELSPVLSEPSVEGLSGSTLEAHIRHFSVLWTHGFPFRTLIKRTATPMCDADEPHGYKHFCAPRA
ncbi:hypothetical protein A0H81_01751 [Grifola frondosa]|uniref:Uncharacterized protein n=1 Tax=Grifola frondosa TaxID=5627 RepID=A0A1C7MMY9_GRIFR|nr:hypothetical protein A0H81_01751 [Grifola frondosa]